MGNASRSRSRTTPRARTEPAVAFLASYPAEVAELALETRARVLEALPGVAESVDVPARMLAYAYGPGYAGMVCTIIPSQKGVKLGLYRGSELPDPDGLLSGTGRVHRHVVVRSADVPRPAAIARLLKAARAAWKVRQG
jgi:hypothetical protein